MYILISLFWLREIFTEAKDFCQSTTSGYTLASYHLSGTLTGWTTYLLPLYHPLARHQTTQNSLYIPEHTEIYSEEAYHKSAYSLFPCFSCGSHDKDSCPASCLHLLPLLLSWCFLMWSCMLWCTPFSKKQRSKLSFQ